MPTSLVNLRSLRLGRLWKREYFDNAGHLIPLAGPSLVYLSLNIHSSGRPFISHVLPFPPSLETLSLFGQVKNHRHRLLPPPPALLAYFSSPSTTLKSLDVKYYFLDLALLNSFPPSLLSLRVEAPAAGRVRPDAFQSVQDVVEGVLVAKRGRLGALAKLRLDVGTKGARTSPRTRPRRSCRRRRCLGWGSCSGAEGRRGGMRARDF